MKTTRIVFHCWGAYVAEIVSETVCKVWLTRPTGSPFPRSHLVTLDLGKTPNAAAQSDPRVWDVEVDDHNDAASGGATRLGGQFPWASTAEGVYIAEGQHHDILKDTTLVWPPAPLPGIPASAPHQLQALLFIDDDGKTVVSRRYHGFHAKLEALGGDGTGTFLVVEEDHGTDLSKGKRVKLDLKLDLDWDEPGALSTVRNVGDEGALFVRWKAAHTAPVVGAPAAGGATTPSTLSTPKVPRALGGRFLYYYSPERPHVP